MMDPLVERRNQPERLTLSRKVSLAVCLAVVSLIGFLLVEGIRELKVLLADLSQDHVQSLASLLRSSLEDPRLWDSPGALQSFVERLGAPPADDTSQSQSPGPGGGLDILILDTDRRVLAGRPSGEVGKRYNRDPGGEVGVTMADGRVREFVVPGVPPTVWVVAPLEVKHLRKATLLFRSPSQMVAGRGAQKLIIELSREAILIAIPTLVLILWMTRRYLLKPIRLLKEGAAAWKRGGLSHRVSFRGSDELGELRDAFNEMAGTLEAQHADLARKQADLEESFRRNREAQAQLSQSEKLASLGTLAAGVAHELNQPLMLIRGYAQRLLSRENEVGRKAREEIEIIEQETGRMMKIIRHLKDFSRRSTGEHQEVDINAIVRSSLALCSEQLRLHNIEVRLALDDPSPLVWGDPIQLTQVFVNLITNAREALEEAGGGALVVQCRRTQAHSVEVSFADTGHGVEPEVLPRIFDPFFTTKAVGSGTGLGLSIALGLAQAHGGQITVDSQSGQGARFTVRLPATGGKKNGAGQDPGGR